MKQVIWSVVLVALMTGSQVFAAPGTPTDKLAADASKAAAALAPNVPAVGSGTAANLANAAAPGLNGKNCPTTGSTPAEDQAFADAAKKKKKAELFFELQFLAMGNDNKMAIASTPIGRINVTSVITDYANSTGMTRAQILAMTDAQLKVVLANGASGLEGQAKTDAIDNALLIMRASALGSESAMFSMIAEQSRGMSFGRKVGLIATFLAAFSDNYDEARTGSGPASEGAVSLRTMMGAINTNLATGTQIDAGVCRDMHQGAAQLARAMGIDEAFTVGFKLVGGGHRTLVLTDPNNRGRVYQLNYGNVTEQTVGGPSALSQNGSLPDAGIRFRIYDANGRPAIILPSDRGTILNLVTGGTDQQLDLMLHSNNTINQGGLNTPYGTFRIFVANAAQGNGEQVVGAAYNIHVDYNKVFYGEYGLAAFQATRPTEAGQQDAIGVYAQTTQGANINLYQRDRFRLFGFGELSLRGSYAYTTLGDKDDHIFDYNVSARYGLGTEFYTGPVHHTSTLTAQTFVDQANALDSSQGIALRTPTVAWMHRIDGNLGRDVHGSLGVGLTYRDLGTDDYWQYVTEAGLDSRRTGTSVALRTEGALSRDLPLWVPGSEHTGTLQVNQRIFGDHLNVGVKGQQSFENVQNHSLFFTLGGHF
ncbi:MAG: hypothetical protein A2X86_03320 [Bdellovibrionales bacterium GWA2_49_15]|nr:MAG: hypothetical protein A2X86_03320 [Bdellovibrionales bacterium GWA2_49_15]HAZ12245.1 hypothetical protein [Bdellovibrionales bacterium]